MKEMIYGTERETEILFEGTYEGYNFFIVSYGIHPCAYVEIPKEWSKELLRTLYVTDGDDENLKYVSIYFDMNYDTGYGVWLGGAVMRYSNENKWDSGYEKAINGVIGTQEYLDEAKKTIQNRQERLNSTN